MRNFPSLIHVTWDDSDREPYLLAHTNGVQGLEENGQRVALYQLVDDGTTRITKEFVSRRRKATRGRR